MTDETTPDSTPPPEGDEPDQSLPDAGDAPALDPDSGRPTTELPHPSLREHYSGEPPADDVKE